MENKTELPIGYMKQLVEVCLPTLLQLAAKDERFRKLVLAGMAKDIQKVEAAHGVDKHVVALLKGVFDEMIVDRQDREIPYGRKNPNSARLSLFRATAYIVDYEDPDGKYAHLKDQIELQESKEKTNIRLTFVRDENSPAFEVKKIARDMAVVTEQLSWRNAIGEFLGASSPGQLLSLSGLSLSEDDLKVVMELFLDQPEYRIHSVTPNEIKIERI